MMVAVNDGTGLQYLLTDHLGSTVAVTDNSGTLTSQQRYLPFGEERAIPNSPILATDFGYTGQRLLDSGMGGIMDYKARFYSPYLNRFLQPDTIIPDQSNPQSWNRFSYVGNNPVRFNDPTGHYACDEEDSNGDCVDYDLLNKRLQTKLKNFKEPDRVKEKEKDCSYWGKCLAPQEVTVLKDHFGWGFEPLLMYNWMNLAGNTAYDYYPDLDGDGQLLNDPGDAFRHAYWSALIARVYGEDFAMDFTTAHETQPNNDSNAREQSFMDLHNNAIGIQISTANPNASKQELAELVYAALRDGRLYVWDGENMYYSNSCPYCTYP